jgi:Predicted membrane protein (DUF2339)
MEPEDLGERVARLEAQVAWLLQRQQPPGPKPQAQNPVPRPGPARPRPAGPPAARRKEASPVAWIAGIAAAIFLLGAIFFFRWAIEQGWVGAGLRFLLGLLVGGAITAFAARLTLGGSRRLGVSLLLAGLGTLQFTFRAGAVEYHLYGAPLGLAATALVTLLAGAMAARGRSSGALNGALVSGLVAPLVFSRGGHHEVALAVYLAVLLAAALAVPYLARVGGTWHGARWTALLGIWLLLGPSCATVPKADAALLGALLAFHLLLAGLWTWLPGAGELPGTATGLWLAASILATPSGWLIWQRLGWAPEAFVLPVVAVAVLNLALVPLLRKRLDDRRADGGLFVLATGHLALAVPVALAWRWVGPLWGLFALGLAWASLRMESRPFPEEARALRWLGAALALLTTLRWAFHGLDELFLQRSLATPLLHSAFAEGALASAAWFLLSRRGGPLGWIAFLGLQLTANLTLAFEAARTVLWFQRPLRPGWGLSRAASVAMTLVWALSGAWQWMRGLGRQGEARRALMVAGYGWMGLAGFKLLASDLDRADAPLRALAFLGVGAIGMGAAVLANRRRGVPS